MWHFSSSLESTSFSVEVEGGGNNPGLCILIASLRIRNWAPVQCCEPITKSQLSENWILASGVWGVIHRVSLFLREFVLFPGHLEI